MNWNNYTYPERVYIAYLLLVMSDHDNAWYDKYYTILEALGDYYTEMFKGMDFSDLDELLY